MTDAETETFEGYLILDWRSGEQRQRKTEPTDLAPHQLAIPYSIDVDVPEVTVPTIEAAIEVPEAEVEQSIVEETRELADECETGDA
jgi:hypothetical protein